MSDDLDIKGNDGGLDEGWWDSVLGDGEVGEEVQERPAKKKKKPRRRINEMPGTDWAFVYNLLKEDMVVNCNVKGHNQGGLLVSNEKFHGFVPVSHLLEFQNHVNDNQYKNLNEYVGKPIQLKVIECEERRGRIVLSERAALAAPGKRQELFKAMETQDVLTGTITNITEFGIFIDLGGVEGLAHISELSWKRVSDPNDLFRLGDELDVMVLELDNETNRVSLSIKRLQLNPWETVKDQFPPGLSISGFVINVVKFGAFVRLENGLEGLIHISEMSLDDTSSPWDILDNDQAVTVEVVTVDVKRQRMSLRLIE